MKNFIQIGAVALVLSACAGAAQAQIMNGPAVPVAKPTSIKLGVFLPSNSSGRSVSGDTLFSAGIDYAFQKSSASSPVLPLVYADYAGGSKSGGHMDLYGVGVGVRVYPQRSNTEQFVPYYGAGIGLDFLNGKSRNGSSKTNTEIGGKLDIGLEMNTGPFVEAAYQIVPQKAAGIRGDGFNIMIGDRF